MYQQVNPPFEDQAAACVKRIADNAYLPINPDNTDYSQYLQWLADGNTPEPAEVPPVVVPQSVTRFQALAALHIAGHLPAVQAIMAAPETPILTKLAWDNALSFERSSPTLAGLAAVLELTDADLDALFTAAAGIEA